MATKPWNLVVAAVLGMTAALWSGSTAEAQPTVLPAPGPSGTTLGAPIGPAPYALAPGQLQPPPPPLFAPVDPGPDGWGPNGLPSLDDRLFFNAELDFLGPAIKNRLRGNVTLPDGTTDTVAVPAANLDWTVSPRFQLGYRLPDSQGEIVGGYRFVVSEGRGTAVDTAGDSFNFRSRLNLNQFDLDYASARYSPGPFWDLKWVIGAQLATVFFDSRAENPFFEQHASNYFAGVGPHFGVDADRRFKLLEGLSAFGRMDGAVEIGQVRQHFHESAVQADGTVLNGDFSQQKTQTVPVLTLEGGLRYAPPRMEFLHLSTGYQFERWWRLGTVGDSRGELTTQGVFFRAEVDY
jgi:hypothetical protein